MQESTIWTVTERTDQKIDSLREVIKKAHETRLTKEDEDYQYAIHNFKEGTIKNTGYSYAQLVKYKKEPSIESFDLANDKIDTENTRNPPIVGYSNFVVFDKYLLIEQKGNTLGQRQVLNAILEFYAETAPEIDLGFMLDTKILEDFIETQEKITLIRFSNIILNPNNPDENVQKFEDIIRDSNSKNTEFSNSAGDGINKNSKIMNGGFTLLKLNKLNVKIESETEGSKQIFNSAKGRNKLKEKISYERGERDTTVFHRFLEKIRELL